MVETPIQRIALQEHLPHHADVRPGQDEIDVVQTIVDDLLKSRIHRLRRRHGLQIGDLVNDDDELTGNGIDVGKDVLQPFKVRGKGKDARAHELPGQSVYVLAHRSFQAFIIYTGLCLPLKRLLDQRRLPHAALPIDERRRAFSAESLRELAELLLPADEHDFAP